MLMYNKMHLLTFFSMDRYVCTQFDMQDENGIIFLQICFVCVIMGVCLRCKSWMTMAINGYCNNPIGLGGSTRRLHHIDALYIAIKPANLKREHCVKPSVRGYKC